MTDPMFHFRIIRFLILIYYSPGLPGLFFLQFETPEPPVSKANSLAFFSNLVAETISLTAQ